MYPSNSGGIARDLKAIVTEARPLIEQQLELTEKIAGLREAATAKGLDWSQIKALLKAQIADENDESGEGKRVTLLLAKAEHATDYAALLGLNMNEKNYFASDEASESVPSNGGEAKVIRSSRTGADEPTASLKPAASDKTSLSGLATEPIPADEADNQSTAARKDVPEVTRSGRLRTGISGDSDPAPLQLTDVRAPGEPERAPKTESGYQAPPVDTQSPVRPFAGAVTSSAGMEASAESDENRPAISDAAKNALRLRPHCQAAMRDELSKCGGYGKVHCHDCLKVHADAEGLTA